MAGVERDVTCPHCHKEFTGTVLGAGGQRGFKCPHCRLFVPYDRTEEQKLVDPAKT
jgi:tRNA(Ile2) C34 agmatinyltransferase TiaS